MVVLPAIGRYGYAALFHEFVYWEQDGLTRKEADLVFRDTMDELGVPTWKTQTLYGAVRLFGGSAGTATRSLRRTTSGETDESEKDGSSSPKDF